MFVLQALEYNMSISSQYLEELSRRYKRQMEEMQKQFNLTIAALNATSHQAFERDQHQQRHIEAIEEQLATVIQTQANLISTLENLSNHVVEQHLFLMVVEVVVLCLVFTFCHRRAPQYHVTTTNARAQVWKPDIYIYCLPNSLTIQYLHVAFQTQYLMLAFIAAYIALYCSI